MRIRERTHAQNKFNTPPVNKAGSQQINIKYNITT